MSGIEGSPLEVLTVEEWDRGKPSKVLIVEEWNRGKASRSVDC
jgi:hypothetical protein